MKKCIFLFLFLSVSHLLSSQNFELVGTRLTEFDWSFPDPIAVNQDSEGNYFIYLAESAEPRNPELVKLDASTGVWDDITMNGLNTPAQSTTDGIVMDDGTTYFGMRSFDNNYYGYKVSADGTLEQLGTGAIPTNGVFGIETATTMDSEGKFYVAGVLNGGFCSVFDDDTWTSLPNFQLADPPLDRSPGLAVDENDNLYVVFEEKEDNTGDDILVKLRMLSPGATDWTTLYEETESSNVPTIYAVSSSEVYITYWKQQDDAQFYYYVKMYNGSTMEDIGDPIVFDYDECDRSDVIKLSGNNKLYLSTCEDIYEYDPETNAWTVLTNDIADNGIVTSFNDRFYEADDGSLINVISNAYDDEFAVIKYTPDDLGTVEYDYGKVTLAPNPTSNSFIVSMQKEEISKVEIFSTSGKLIQNYTLKPVAQLEVDLSDQPDGVYLVKLNGKETYKVVKK